MQSLEEERDKWAEGGGKLPGGRTQPTDAMLKAAGNVQKMIEEMKDKIAIEAARERGGNVEAELEKAAIDWRKRNEAINKAAEAAGKASDLNAVKMALALSSVERTGDEIKALEKQRDAAIKITQKSVDEREKQEQHLADAIEKIRMKVQEREAQRQEKYLEMMGQYNEALRQAQERMPRPWDQPGSKEREREMHDFITEQNKLEALRRRGEERLPGGIDPDRYQELMDKLGQVHKERMKQIEDTTSQATARISQLWTDMAQGMEGQFSDIFMDVFQGKLKTLGDYFNNFANLIAASFSRAMANMLTEWIQTQARMELSGIGKFLGKIFGAGVGAGGEEWTPENSGTFAKGGVFDSPRVFRFARGIGMLGEAGPEAVMPLKRTASGDLGVIAAGGGGGGKGNVSVQIINESGSKMEVKKSTASFDVQGMVITAWLDGYNRDVYGLRTAMGR
jgi:lambda family phage tail tape measure protein